MNAMHPGTVRSNLGATNFMTKAVVRSVGIFLRPPEYAATNILSAIERVDSYRVCGEYFNELSVCPLKYLGNLDNDARFILSKFPRQMQGMLE